MILTKTPYRVSLIGGGTDYPEWFLAHRGAVIGMAINKYCYVGVKHMPPGQLLPSGEPLRYRVQYSKVDDCGSVAEIRHPAVRAALQYYNLDIPLEFHVFGDLPGRSGLGGSSAFAVGLLNALQLLFNVSRQDSKFLLAQEAIALERDVIKEAVGLQDQILTATGGLNRLNFSITGSEVVPMNLAPEREALLTSSFVLVYSGTMRDSHVQAQKQIDKIPDNSIFLNRMLQLVEVLTDTLLRSREDSLVKDVGNLLQDAWGYKQALHPDISSPQIDELYQNGLNCGAYGGKLLGAGGGGFFLFCVNPDHMATFINKMQVLGHAHFVRFKVDRLGSRAIITEND